MTNSSVMYSCRKTFKFKGNKKFRTWTKKSSSVFRVSGFLCSMYICYEHSMYVSHSRIMGMIQSYLHFFPVFFLNKITKENSFTERICWKLESICPSNYFEMCAEIHRKYWRTHLIFVVLRRPRCAVEQDSANQLDRQSPSVFVFFFFFFFWIRVLFFVDFSFLFLWTVSTWPISFVY